MPSITFTSTRHWITHWKHFHCTWWKQPKEGRVHFGSWSEIQAIMVGKGWHWEWQEDGYIVSTVRKHRDACLPSLNSQITVHTPGKDKRTLTNVLSSGAHCLSLSTYVSLPYFLPPALFSGYEEEDNEGCTRSNKCLQNWVAYCHDPSLIDLLV